MYKRRLFIRLLLTIPFIRNIAAAPIQHRSAREPAFNPGEKLTYSLGWQFITAGKATLEVLSDKTLKGKTVRHFQMTAKTGRITDKVFKVRDTLTSVAEYDVSRSLGYKKNQREGKTKRDITVNFDLENLEAHYVEAIKEKRLITPIEENTLDPLSAFYFIRNQELAVGQTFQGPMTDGKRCKMAKISVVKREKIKVNGKRYDTFKLIPDIQDIGGVFEKSDDAKIEIWCTADHRHIPVLMKSKVLVGSFKAELESGA